MVYADTVGAYVEHGFAKRLLLREEYAASMLDLELLQLALFTNCFLCNAHLLSIAWHLLVNCAFLYALKPLYILGLDTIKLYYLAASERL